jgi:hypothetical protein
VFERLWKERLGWREADAAAVGAWRDTMTKLTNSAHRAHPHRCSRTLNDSIQDRPREQPPSWRHSNQVPHATSLGALGMLSIRKRPKPS